MAKPTCTHCPTTAHFAVALPGKVAAVFACPWHLAHAVLTAGDDQVTVTVAHSLQ